MSKADDDVMDKLEEAMHACLSGDIATLTRLLDEETALVQRKNSSNVDRTLLHVAAEEGRPRMVETLLKLQASLRARDANGETPLHLAAKNGRPSVTKILLERGADVNARNLRGQTPVFLLIDRFPCESDVFDAVDNRDANGEDPGAAGKPKAVWRPLQWILKALRVTSNEAQLIGADRDRESEEEPDYAATIRALVSAEADLRLADDDHTTPLHRAVNSGNPALVTFLLSHGAAVGGQSLVHPTPLDDAVRHGYDDMVRALVEGGFRVTALSAESIERFIRDDKGDMFAYLLRSGVDPDVRDCQEQTLLHRAVIHGRRDMVEVLLECGAELEATDQCGYTAMHFAALMNQPSLVPVLTNSGASPDARDTGGNTPALLAEYNGHSEVLEALEAGGADLSLRNDRLDTGED